MIATSDRAFLKKYAWLSIGAAILTLSLKTVAYYLTGSVGLLSDALESIVNLVGAIMALTMLGIAAQPADEDHTHGHSKAEYFSSGLEGGLILVAAIGIAWAAIPRIMAPKPLEQVGLGLIVSVSASLVNLGAALVIGRAGFRHDSITLKANAHHLMTDVWTSAGVLVGVGLVALTGWLTLDPIVALLVAANIVWTGVSIVRESVHGLMDTSLPEEDIIAVREVLDAYNKSDGIEYHALRTRRAGSRRFVTVHILVPDAWSIKKSHALAETVEASICKALPGASVLTHIEPLGDPASHDDIDLDRHIPHSCPPEQ